jgi:hypothetical protein
VISFKVEDDRWALLVVGVGGQPPYHTAVAHNGGRFFYEMEMTSSTLKINHRQNCNGMHYTTLILTCLREFKYWITFEN